MNNSINQVTCKRCYFCVDVCPAKYIGKNDTGMVYFKNEKSGCCAFCGQCMAICDTKSICIDTISYEKNIFRLNDSLVDFEKFYNFIGSRRSTRNFKDKPVPKELIEKIILSLSQAPYGASPDNVEITIITDRKVIEKALPYMSEFFSNIGRWMKNPFMRYMIKSKKGIETLNTLKNHLLPKIETGHYDTNSGIDNITRKAPVLIIFHAPVGNEEHTDDAMIYSVYASLAAHSLGLGATHIGLVPAAINKMKEVKEIFKIPEENEAVISLIIGYPKYHFKNGIKRERTKVTWIEGVL